MGLLVDGVWTQDAPDGTATSAGYKRKASTFRNWITPDGTAGPSGTGSFKAEADRYHLYISWACPWAHRAAIYRSLKGLQNLIGLSVVHWHMCDRGWAVRRRRRRDPRSHPQRQPSDGRLLRRRSKIHSRVTVPVLWDKQTATIVSNESSEIIRMFNSAFDSVGAHDGNYYPRAQHSEIDALNERIYETVNNGVYRAGFAKTQQNYNEAVTALFDTLDVLEDILDRNRYLCGAAPTEADWRLLPTLLRFDSVYVGHFKCNNHRLIDYPNLFEYTCDLYQHPGIAETCNFEHMKNHYYASMTSINPTGIIPVGPITGFDIPHNRT